MGRDSSHGSALDGRLLLSSIRNTGSGTVGFDESFALQRRAGETTLSGVDLSGRRLFARTDDRTLVVDLRLSKDSRNLQGTISADGTIALSAKAIRAGEDLGVPVRIGQETSYLGDGPTEVKQTFFGQTMTQMEAQLVQVSAAYDASPAFAGLAIHDAASYAVVAP